MARSWPWSTGRTVNSSNIDAENGKAASGSQPLLAEGPAGDEKAKSRCGGAKGPLIMYTVILLLSSVGNQVYFKRMTSAMPNYAWYLTQLSTVIYIPFFASLAGPAIVSNMRWDFVQKFAVMGVFDGISGTLMVLGGTQTSGTLQVLLSQAVIPFTILFSVVMLRKRFHLLQHAGATIIVLGIVLAKAGGKPSADDSNNPVLNVIFLLAVVPCALSSVFKEVAFRGSDEDLDVNVLQFWVAVFQFLTNFCAMPIYTLELLGPQRVSISEMPRLAIGGTKCLFLLEDQVTRYCGLTGEKPCDHCSDAWQSVFIYLAFNLTFNISIMLVIKHGSAALSFLVSTLRMPLASLAFASPLIMGAQAVQPGLGDLISLIIIMSGLCTYRYGGRLLKTAMKREAAEEGMAVPLASPNGLWPSPNNNNTIERDNQKWSFAPILSTGFPGMEPTIVLQREKRPGPRTADRVRADLYHKLGAASPLHSPKLRAASPRTSPGRLYSPSASEGSDRETPPDAEERLRAAGKRGAGDANFDITGLDEAVGPRRPGVMRKASEDPRVGAASRRERKAAEKDSAAAAARPP